MNAHPDPQTNPYVGPRPFETGEPLYGRDKDILKLYHLLLSERIVLLYSPSGAGKSSLVEAGLIPKLRGEFSVLPRIRVNQEPPEELAAKEGFNRYAFSAILSLEETPHGDSQTPPEALASLTLAEYLSQRPAREAAPPTNGHGGGEEGEQTYEILIFDQFEEILTTAPNDLEGRRLFFDQVGEVLRDKRRWALFVAREDFVAAFDPYLRSIPTRLANRYRLDFLDADLALEAIQKPARDEHANFQDTAARKLVDDLREVQVQRPDGTMATEKGPYVEPVQLQVVCRRLWERLSVDDQEVQEITEQDITSSGDVNESLAAYYSDQVCGAEEKFAVPQRIIREWFGKSLINSQGRRIQVMLEPENSGGLDNRVIDFMDKAHLVRSGKGRGAIWFELTHDRLVGPILEDNQKWFAQNLSPLQRRAALWVEQGKDETLLFTGLGLLVLEEWAEAHLQEMSGSDQEYLKACRAKDKKEKLEKERQVQLGAAEKVAAEQARSARQARRLTRIAFGLLGVALIGAALAISGFFTARQYAGDAATNLQTAEAASRAAEAASTQAVAQKSAAEAASTQAVQQEHLAFAGQLGVQSQATNDDQLSLLLAIEALNQAKLGGKSNLPIADDVLRKAVEQSGGIPLSGHTETVYVVTFSPDGQWLASASGDSTVRVWDMTSDNPDDNPMVLSGHTGSIYSLAFSPDGHSLASGSDDSTVRVWDMTSENPADDPLILSGHANFIYSLVFSPDGHWLASGSGDNTVRVWDMTSDNPDDNPMVLSGHTDSIWSLAFSPDGHWLASGSGDNTVRVWDMTSDNPPDNPMVLSGHTDSIWSVAFSPDGRWLASGSADNSIRVWDMTSDNPADNPMVLSGHTDSIYSLAFSPDGRWLASGSADNAVRVWDMTSDNPADNPMVLSGHTDSIYSLAFSPDGRWLASGGADSTARLWDTLTQFEIEAPISQYEAVGELEGDAGQIDSLSFSPEGIWLASAGAPGHAQLWNFQTGIPNESSGTLAEPVFSPQFEPEGGILYGGNEDLYSLYSEQLGADNPPPTVVNFPGHKGNISKLAYSSSSSGEFWASPNDTNTIQFWTGDASITLSGTEQGTVNSLVISPDGRWLASGSADGTIHVWRLDSDAEKLSSEEPTVLPESNAAGINALAFSRDSQWLAGAGDEGTILVWDVSGEDVKGKPVKFGDTMGPVSALAFSPRGRWLVSGGTGPNLTLWDMLNPAADPITLSGDEGPAFAIAFSPDGRWLVSGGKSDRIQIWGSGIEQLLRKACHVVGRNLEWQEWRSYFNNENYHITCPNRSFPASVADHFLSPGDKLARSGDTNGAIAEYSEALEKCPEILCPGFRDNFVPSPKVRANTQAAQALLEEGDALAQKGELEAAITKYQEALKFDSTIIPDNATPELRAKQEDLGELLDSIAELNSGLEYEASALKFLDAQDHYPDILERIGDQFLLNNLCWWGSLLGHAPDVQQACEKAVHLDPTDGQLLDSRGLNRALLGDYDGAIADFEIAIKWMSDNEYGEDFITEREAWIKALKDGMNPFDAATLEHLQSE